ncbi:MAG: hypothetical protein LAN62_03335 [Acidobacteriia bacterium]|nr:hypothetical protein [Terriglobia bacterium]
MKGLIVAAAMAAKGVNMISILKYGGLMFGTLFAVNPAGGAEPVGGPSVTVEYYYKLAPGATKEWLALYTKNHNPILKQLMKEGILKSEKLYERRFHAATPAWDYKVVMVWRDWAALQEAHAREPEIIRALYPDKDDRDRQEKRRWEITLEHWDDVLNEVPLD